MDLSGSGDVLGGGWAMRTPHIFAAMMDSRWGSASDLIWYLLPQSHCTPYHVLTSLYVHSNICVLNNGVFMGALSVTREAGSKAAVRPTAIVRWKNISIRNAKQRLGSQRAYAHPQFMTHLLNILFRLFVSLMTSGSHNFSGRISVLGIQTGRHCGWLDQCGEGMDLTCVPRFNVQKIRICTCISVKKYPRTSYCASWEPRCRHRITH